jgi:hypothetical protein
MLILQIKDLRNLILQTKELRNVILRTKELSARARGSGHRAQEERKAQPMWDTRKNKADLVNKGLSKR